MSKFRYNPLIYSGFDMSGTGGSGPVVPPLYQSPVDTEANLPVSPVDGEAHLVRDRGTIFVYDATLGQWVDTGLGVTKDIPETFFAGTEGVISPSDITAFTFDSTVRSFDALVSIQVQATTPLFETVKVIGVNKGNSWLIYTQNLGDDSDVDLYIDTSGQIQYTSSVYPGFISLEIKFRAITLND